jgi:NDP-sugar pyrophosphorylase family protein
VKPPVVILCGGRGTRLREKTESVPKPLVEIGGRPILWHVIGIYAAQGFDRFLLASGYLGEQIERFVAEERWPAPVSVECVDTGVDTPPAGGSRRSASGSSRRPSARPTPTGSPTWTWGHFSTSTARAGRSRP